MMGINAADDDHDINGDNGSDNGDGDGSNAGTDNDSSGGAIGPLFLLTVLVCHASDPAPRIFEKLS
jgi:hypothetical protein